MSIIQGHGDVAVSTRMGFLLLPAVAGLALTLFVSAFLLFTGLFLDSFLMGDELFSSRSLDFLFCDLKHKIIALGGHHFALHYCSLMARLPVLVK